VDAYARRDRDRELVTGAFERDDEVLVARRARHSVRDVAQRDRAVLERVLRRSEDQLEEDRQRKRLLVVLETREPRERGGIEGHLESLR
jgi:hypothetical protein